MATGSPDLYLVVMAGGSGTRFWPKSTSKKPKQLLSFGNDEETLLERTLQRFEGWVPSSHRMIVTTRALSEAVRTQAKGAEVLAEPQGRNTAPCVYWAARAVAERNPRGILLVMPSDHYVANPSAFLKTAREAADWAAQHDDLVTLGISPSRPETGYGYLRVGEKLSGSCRRVAAFVEKPNLEKAREFVKSGEYLWNGGMFLWRADVILKAFDTLMPEMKKAWDKAHGEVTRAYPEMTATSIDYGIMEKSKNVVTFALDCGWDDLGSWTSLEELADVLHARCEAGVVTAGETIAIESSDNIIDAPQKLVALLGIQDLIIVDTGSTLLVAHKDRAQEIRQVVEKVKNKRPDLA